LLPTGADKQVSQSNFMLLIVTLSWGNFGPASVGSIVDRSKDTVVE